MFGFLVLVNALLAGLAPQKTWVNKRKKATYGERMTGEMKGGEFPEVVQR
jgi:hypothetical protein